MFTAILATDTHEDTPMREAKAEASEWESEQTALKEAGEAVEAEFGVVPNADTSTETPHSPKLGDGAPPEEVQEIEKATKPKV